METSAGGGGYTGGNALNNAGEGGASYSIDPDGTKKIGWVGDGKCIITLQN